MSSLEGIRDPKTLAIYELYVARLAEAFERIDSVTPQEIRAYTADRLRSVLRQTVRKELSALRGILALELGDDAPMVPPPPRLAAGRRAGGRVAAIDLSEPEVRALLKALPARGRGGFPIRARFLVAYESGQRPSTIERLSVPENYRPGASHLTLWESTDKGRQARTVPLSRAARDALDRVCPKAGLIFGRHDFRRRIERAARAALSPERAELFCAAHLRSARITHWLDGGAPLTAASYLAGHRQVATTSRYARATERAARRVVSGEEFGGRKRRRS